MSKFRGTFPHTVDSKGRMSVPNKFRDVLKAKDDNRLVITFATDYDCLSVYPLTRWQEVEDDLDALPASKAKNAFIRRYVAPAMDVNMDKMGRVLIPAQLREKTELGKEVMVVGALSKFELWDRDKWEALQESDRDDANELLQQEHIRF